MFIYTPFVRSYRTRGLSARSLRLRLKFSALSDANLSAFSSPSPSKKATCPILVYGALPIYLIFTFVLHSRLYSQLPPNGSPFTAHANASSSAPQHSRGERDLEALERSTMAPSFTLSPCVYSTTKTEVSDSAVKFLAHVNGKSEKNMKVHLQQFRLFSIIPLPSIYDVHDRRESTQAVSFPH